MGDKSKIEWTDATWSPVTGCNKISPGCKHCYAERMAVRLQKMGAAKYRNGFDVTLHEEALRLPLQWKRLRMIFVNSMSDLFHADVPDWFIDRVFAVMALAYWHTFQILTKRADRMAVYTRTPYRMEAVGHQAMALLEEAGNGTPEQFAIAAGLIHGTESHILPGNEHLPPHIVRWPLSNVWPGVSVEDKNHLYRVEDLLQTPAAVRFLSAEPMLGEIRLDSVCTSGDKNNPKSEHWNYTNYLTGDITFYHRGEKTEKKVLPGLDLVICGGESGPKARPMHPEWVRDLRDQCVSAGVPFFFKQFGEWFPDPRMFHSKEHWIAKAQTWVCGGTCIDMTGKVLKCGLDFDSAVYPVAIVHRIGKKKAGRLLDEKEWNEMPERRVSE